MTGALPLMATISIHTPLAGSDRRDVRDERSQQRISIHTPLAGSDTPQLLSARPRYHFNPHSPRGE